MRVYVPATWASLGELWSARSLPAPFVAAAVTPALRADYDPDADLEELEFVALLVAAEASLGLIDADPLVAKRRVVVAVDVPDQQVVVSPDDGVAAVRVLAAVPMAAWASVHVDDDGGGEDDDLLWYAPQEIPELLAQ